MHCRIARKTLIDAELGLAGPGAREALDAHLRACSACATAAELERGLTADLAALHIESPFPIEVTPVVSTRLSGLPPAKRGEVGFLQALASVAAIAGCGSLLLAGMWRIGPSLSGLVADAQAFLAGLRLAASNMVAPGVALFGALIRAAGGLLVSLEPLAEELHALQPLAVATIAACAVMMVSSIVLVVGRDLRRARCIREVPR